MARSSAFSRFSRARSRASSTLASSSCFRPFLLGGVLGSCFSTMAMIGGGSGWAGRDGTRLFGEVHPWVNYENMLSECLIGIAIEEREPKVEMDLESMD